MRGVLDAGEQVGGGCRFDSGGSSHLSRVVCADVGLLSNQSVHPRRRPVRDWFDEYLLSLLTASTLTDY